MRQLRSVSLALWAIVISSALMGGCGKNEAIVQKEQQAIQLVKAFKESDNAFSIVSNIQKKSDDDGRAGNKWDSTENWEAGLPSQQDLMMERLSQFFNVFRPSGNYWVKLSYKDKDGLHEALWDVNVYSKKVVAKNELAQQLVKGS
ncbi:MAG: hypothetical protein FJ147_20155 [Deltaproteobacteria bacterium]|nr:hypothetical protein [Deltaproteobacteria bacterium]